MDPAAHDPGIHEDQGEAAPSFAKVPLERYEVHNWVGPKDHLQNRHWNQKCVAAMVLVLIRIPLLVIYLELSKLSAMPSPESFYIVVAEALSAVLLCSGLGLNWVLHKGGKLSEGCRTALQISLTILMILNAFTVVIDFICFTTILSAYGHKIGIGWVLVYVITIMTNLVGNYSVSCYLRQPLQLQSIKEHPHFCNERQMPSTELRRLKSAVL